MLNRTLSLVALLAASLVDGCATRTPPTSVERQLTPIAKPPPAGPAAGTETYTVKRGDTLFSIAREHGVDYRELLALNNLAGNWMLEVGQVLRLRPPGTTTSEARVQVRPIAGAAPIEAEILAGVAKIIVTTPASKIGAGIVVRRDDDQAYLVTAAHVVSGADAIDVQFLGAGRSWPAEVRHIEAENLAQGLALLRVPGPLPAEVRALPLATEFTAAGGEQVNIIGHQPSIGGGWGVLAGIVSGRKGREVVIQAPIQEQTSGGPVVLGGRVVGLVQRKDPSGAFGYAVTALAIREYVQGNNLSLELPRASPQKPEAKAALDANEPDGIDWAWPASGRVLANFSDANKGIDVAGKVGEPVYASAAGRVVYSGAGLRGYGNLIIVKHNDSYLSAYAHNSKLFVKEGQSVSKGQKIAEVGSSDTDQPKLHFEIRHLGKPVDPARYLPSR